MTTEPERLIAAAPLTPTEAWLVQYLDREPTLNETLDDRQARKQWQSAAVVLAALVLGVGAVLGFALGYVAHSAEQAEFLPAPCVMVSP